MKTVTAAFQCELRKIFWRAKYWIMLVVYAAIGLGAGLIGAYGYNPRTITEFTFSITGPNVVFGALSVYRTFLIPLAVFMLAADVFTHELESKSIKCVLVRPISRFDAYLAKSLAILSYTGIALGAGFIAAETWQFVTLALSGNAVASAMSAATTSGFFGGVLAVAEGLPAIAEALASYALTMLPMAAFIAVASFIAVLIRSPALVMFLCIVIYILFAFFGTFYAGAGAALFTTYSSWYRMWFGVRLPWRNLLAASGLLLSTIVAFFGFGYFIFDKKEI